METESRPETASTAGGAPAHVPGPARGRRGYFLPGVIALVALLGIGLLWGAGDLEHPAATNLAGPDVAAQISLGIQAQENATRPPSVSCPAKEPVHQGQTFDCTVAGSPPRLVHVTEVDGRGRLQWSFTASH
jgi:hypothetical protein